MHFPVFFPGKGLHRMVADHGNAVPDLKVWMPQKCSIQFNSIAQSPQLPSGQRPSFLLIQHFYVSRMRVFWRQRKPDIFWKNDAENRGIGGKFLACIQNDLFIAEPRQNRIELAHDRIQFPITMRFIEIPVANGLRTSQFLQQLFQFLLLDH